ncbi:hypothetical protein HWA77_22320 [Photobacterium damselae subsp. damselae]|uniref:Uncharacterized protein n=1 Tax=Photobacterium damselae subsp. damselae TaxID=85581 RepID=A0A850R689_PHODD|nr:hypothetical protein [Photobacterium damselae subsp. damselae]
MKKSYIFPIIISFFCVYLWSVISSEEPVIRGDGNEYYLMTESFLNHGSPELLNQDILSAKAKSERDSFTIPYIDNKTISGYYESRDRKEYSYHFFSYSLTVLPFKLISEAFGLNDVKSFYLANVFFLVMAVSVIALGKNSFSKKISLMLMAIFGPGVFYVDWTHPEVLTYSLLFMGVSFYFSGGRRIFYLLFALASFQNPPVILFSSSILFIDLLRAYKDKKYATTFQSIAITGASLIPSVFYLYHYGSPNLIAREGFSDIANISFERVFGLFFSPASGLIIYNSALLLAFIICITLAVICRKNLTYNMAMIFGILIAVCAGATTHNWNSGMDNVIRYAVWIYPLICMFIISVSARYCVHISLFNAIVFVLSTSFVTNLSYVYFNSLSQFIIDKMPRLLAVDYETFCENTAHQDGYIEFNGINSYPCLALDSSNNVRVIYTNMPSFRRFISQESNYSYNDRLNEIVDEQLQKDEFSYIYLPKSVMKRTRYSWNGSDLPSLVGRSNHSGEMLSNGVEGFVTYGPYIKLQPGKYQATIEYTCNGSSDCGYWDIVAGSDGVLYKGSIINASQGKITSKFELLDGQQDKPVEIRTNYNNLDSKLVIKRISIKILD